MTILIKNVRIVDPLHRLDLVDDVSISPEAIVISPAHVSASAQMIDGRNKILAPGLIDLHVHFREPGFCHKETIATGIHAAWAGGFTSALVMPNTLPPLDLPKRVAFQYSSAKRFGFDLMVAAAATSGLQGFAATDIAQLKHFRVRAVTDDGKPILSSSLMESILRKCRINDLVCMQHAEDTSLSLGAPVNQGVVSNKLGLNGQPSSAEFSLVERDLLLAQKTGARYHVLHLSCEETLKLVQKARRDGVLVSAEVTPHHLILCDSDVRWPDTCKKMNPPLRTRTDARSLLEGLRDGSIDAVASDHAPHSRKEKRATFVDAPFGVVGLESAITILLTLVKKGHLSLMRAIEAMTAGPARVLKEHARVGSLIGDGRLKNAVLLDPHRQRIFSNRDLVGMSRNSPFVGMTVFGGVLATFQNGEMVYQWSR